MTNCLLRATIAFSHLFLSCQVRCEKTPHEEKKMHKKKEQKDINE